MIAIKVEFCTDTTERRRTVRSCSTLRYTVYTSLAISLYQESIKIHRLGSWYRADAPGPGPAKDCDQSASRFRTRRSNFRISHGLTLITENLSCLFILYVTDENMISLYSNLFPNSYSSQRLSVLLIVSK